MDDSDLANIAREFRQALAVRFKPDSTDEGATLVQMPQLANARAKANALPDRIYREAVDGAFYDAGWFVQGPDKDQKQTAYRRRITDRVHRLLLVPALLARLRARLHHTPSAPGAFLTSHK
jgi:hypothetical protein